MRQFSNVFDVAFASIFRARLDETVVTTLQVWFGCALIECVLPVWRL